MFTIIPTPEFIAKYKLRPESSAITVKAYSAMIHVHKCLNSFLQFKIELATRRQAERAVEHLKNYHEFIDARAAQYAETNQPDMVARTLRSYRFEFTVSFSKLPPTSVLEDMYADLMIAVTNLATSPLMIRYLSYSDLRAKQDNYLQKVANIKFHQKIVKDDDGVIQTRLDQASSIRLSMIRSMFGISDNISSKHLVGLPADILSDDVDIWCAAWEMRIQQYEKQVTADRRKAHVNQERTLTLADCEHDRELFDACKVLYERKMFSFRWKPGKGAIICQFVTYYGPGRYTRGFFCPKNLLRHCAQHWLAHNKQEGLFHYGTRKTAIPVIINFENL